MFLGVIHWTAMRRKDEADGVQDKGMESAQLSIHLYKSAYSGGSKTVLLVRRFRGRRKLQRQRRSRRENNWRWQQIQEEAGMQAQIS